MIKSLVINEEDFLPEEMFTIALKKEAQFYCRTFG